MKNRFRDWLAGVCGFGILASASNASVLTGPVANPANGHFYYLLSQNNWTASESEAMTMGGHLATIDNEFENAWVYSAFSSFGAAPRALWIGLTDQTHEGTFGWSSGEPLPYTHWEIPQQPDNGNGGSPENFVHLLPPGHYAAGEWNDFQDLANVEFADVPLLGVVQLNGVVEVVPEPSALCMFLAGLFILQARQLRANRVGAGWD